MKLLVILVCFSFFLVQNNPVSGESTSTGSTGNGSEPVLYNNQSYCFEFTWLGPEYDSDNGYNGTCQDYLDTKRAKDVPCSPPFVITYNSTLPDINYLWKNHKTSVLCKKSATQVCARYSYSFNGIMNNQTYMCTKVRAVGEGAVKSGCYTQKKDGYSIEICVCDQKPGITSKPCNNGRIFQSSILILFICYILLYHS